MANLIFVELNEINFDLVRCYSEAGEDLPALTQLIRQGERTSLSEDVY